MTSFAERLNAAATAATCQFLNQFGSGLVGYGAYGLFAGGPAAVPLALGAGALLASNYGCSWNTAGTPSLSNPGPIGDLCWKTNGSFDIDRYDNGAFVGSHIYGVRQILSSTFQRTSNGYAIYEVSYIDAATGSTLTDTYYVGSGTRPTDPVATIKQRFSSGSCTAAGPGSTPTPAPYTYTDTDSGCQLEVNWKGLVTDPDGTPRPVFTISQTGPSSLASGGIIGGCNFQPVIYVGGGGGGGKPPGWGPWDGTEDPDADGRPWWVEAAEKIVTGAVQAAIAEIVRRLITPNVGAKVYRLVSVCETNDQGDPISQSREVSIPDLPLLQAAIYRLDAIEYLLQGLKDFKQPICPPTRFSRQGEPVTVRFQSDEPSDLGNRRLDKRLVYLDQSASPLETHSLHWADFSWQSGPVCVIHKGAPWGVPQVWAASVDEGKRVLRHAGQIAGVDPDQVGEWIVTGTADQRIGQIKTMRVMRRSGLLCVSKRVGGSGLPLLMVDPPRP